MWFRKSLVIATTLFCLSLPMSAKAEELSNETQSSVEFIQDNGNRGAPADEETYVVVAKSGLRVRAESNTDSSIITALPNGTTFEASEIVSGSHDGNSIWALTGNGYMCVSSGTSVYARICENPQTVEAETPDANIQVLEEPAAEGPVTTGTDPLEETKEMSVTDSQSECADEVADEVIPLKAEENVIDESIEKEEAVIADATEEVVSETVIAESYNSEGSEMITESAETIETEPATESVISTDSETVSDEDVYLLAQLMIHEAGGEGAAGLTAVAEVVYNRMKSDYFPDTLRSVIYQKGQFENASAVCKMKPTKESLTIARDILSGKKGVLQNKNILFFRNAGGSTADWGSYKYELSVNHHQFYSYCG